MLPGLSWRMSIETFTPGAFSILRNLTEEEITLVRDLIQI